MARKTVINAVQTAAVESMRVRLGIGVGEFSEALGLGQSTYAEMKRENRVPLYVALAAETLVRRQAPGTDDELVYLTRIVRGVPLVTVLAPSLRRMALDGEQFLLIPAGEPRGSAAKVVAGVRETVTHASNGSPRSAEQPAPDYAEAAQSGGRSG